jgi:hypothetical protein
MSNISGRCGFISAIGIPTLGSRYETNIFVTLAMYNFYNASNIYNLLSQHTLPASPTTAFGPL